MKAKSPPHFFLEEKNKGKLDNLKREALTDLTKEQTGLDC